MMMLVTILFLTWASLAHAQGFGLTTGGDATDATRVVTTTWDSTSPGSLRHAAQCGGCRIEFAVGGDFWLEPTLGPIDLTSFVTLDGSTAPYPGVSIYNHGLRLVGVNDVVIRNIRIIGSAFDGIQIRTGTKRVLVENVYVAYSADGNIDITDGARDVTVRWSVLGGLDKNMLINTGARRVSVYGNILASDQRNPQIRGDACPGTCLNDTAAEVVGNIITWWSPNGHGVLCWFGAKCLVEHNWFSWANGPREQALVVRDGGIAYIRGNQSAHGDPVNSNGVLATGISMPTGLIGVQNPTLKGSGLSVGPSACAHWWKVLRHAGPSPRVLWMDFVAQWIATPPCAEP